MGDHNLSRWIAEYNLDADSCDRIIKIIDNNPISLNHIARLLETVAEICESRFIPMCDAAAFLNQLDRQMRIDRCDQKKEV